MPLLGPRVGWFLPQPPSVIVALIRPGRPRDGDVVRGDEELTARSLSAFTSKHFGGTLASHNINGCNLSDGHSDRERRSLPIWSVRFCHWWAELARTIRHPHQDPDTYLLGALGPNADGTGEPDCHIRWESGCGKDLSRPPVSSARSPCPCLAPQVRAGDGAPDNDRPTGRLRI